MSPSPRDIIDFWLDAGPERWFSVDPDFDALVRVRFLDAHETAARGDLSDWDARAEGALALILLTDQFPRNMFRDQGRAFATDPLARQVATFAWQKKADLGIEPPLRQFFYLPLMHSETIIDQDRCVALFKARMPEAENNLLHARAHREVIRRFGRFPFRNAALGRQDTPAERAFLESGAYGAIVRELGG